MENLQTPAAEIFSQMGLRFLGRQALGKGRADGYLFDAPDNSTLLMDAPINKETVLAKLAEHDEICKAFKRSSADEELVKQIQAEEKFQW